MIKTNYDHAIRETEKSSVNPIAAFDHKYMKKNLKVHPLNIEKLFNGIERKTWSELSEWTSK